MKCKDCNYWKQPEWVLYNKYVKPEDNVTGFCTWRPDYDNIPYYLQYYYGIPQNKHWDGAVQYRDSEACPVFMLRK